MLDFVSKQLEEIICEQQTLIQELLNLFRHVTDQFTNEVNELRKKCNSTQRKSCPPDDDENLSAFVESSTTPAQHQAIITRPISLGVSGGSVVDKISNGCCGGTLGALLMNSNGVRFILSNKHVLASDITSGNNNRVSRKGDSIQQPGLLDINCRVKSSDTVARLTKWKGINKVQSGLVNRIDAAVAKIVSGRVRRDGRILGIGIIARSPATPRVDLKVMKAGRTTGVTFGRIVGIDATVNVQYGVECGSQEGFVAKFVNQLVIQPESSINPNFSLPGDSGSLIVTRSKPARPVGLLFAGGSGVTFANRITDVLKFFRMKIVGKRLTSSQVATSNAVLTAEAEAGLEAEADETEFDREDMIVSESNPRLIKAIQVKRKNLAKILDIPNCKGCYVRVDKRPGIRSTEIVLLFPKITMSMTKKLPAHFEDVPVTAIEIGDIRAY